jgi:hypothetical protein
LRVIEGSSFGGVEEILDVLPPETEIERDHSRAQNDTLLLCPLFHTHTMDKLHSLLKQHGAKLHVVGGPDPYDEEAYDQAVLCFRIYQQKVKHVRDSQKALLGFNTDEYRIVDPDGSPSDDKHPFMLALPLDVDTMWEITIIFRNNGTSRPCKMQFNKSKEEFEKMMDAQKQDKSRLVFFTYRVGIFDDVICRLFVAVIDESGEYKLLQ